MPRLFVVLLFLGVVASARSASASLTSSEQAQIKGFIVGGQVQNAARVRALVARPDLSIDESTSSLSDAVILTPWTEQRTAFFRDMLFGGASDAARPVLVVATTRAALARANAVFAKVASNRNRSAEVDAELLRIYRFIASDIANAGHVQGNAHDPSAGITSSAYDDSAKALADHRAQNPRLQSDASLSPAEARIRAQFQLALYEMTNDTPARRVDAADRLGLTGARRKFLTDLGILLLDAGVADDGRVQKARILLERLPSARVDVEAIYFGEAPGWVSSGLRSRGQIIGVAAPLETTPAATTAPLNGADPATIDLPLFMLAYELSNVAVRRALDNRGDLGVLAKRDVQAAHEAAPAPSAMTVEQELAAVMAQLITDAPRTLTRAFKRTLQGKPQEAAIVSDAMGVLTAFAPAAPPPDGLVIRLAGAGATHGDTDPLPATNVRLAPSGAVTGFTLANHRWEIVRDDAGMVGIVRRDGVPVSLATLPNASSSASSTKRP